jgi:prepilin-type N-terminal cleavage/methylation domain-containing protein
MRVRRRPHLHDERGFTLIELLVAMTVGTVVLLAAFMLLDRSFTASGEIADRSDALQRGRQTMERMTQQLRSQVCLGEANVPIVAANGYSVSFYADLSDGSEPVELRTLTFDPTARTITQSVIPGAGDYPDLTFTSPPTSTILQTKVDPIVDASGTRAPFRYYGFVAGEPIGDLELLGPPAGAPTTALSDDALKRVAVIKLGFRSFADRKLSDDDLSVVIENDVYVRIADPTRAEEGPRCL